MIGWSRRPRAVAVALVVVGGVVLAGCLDSSYRYVKNSSDHLYFKLPKGWHLYDQEELFKLSPDLSQEDKQVRRDQSWSVAFDAAPKASLRHLAGPTSYPTGYAVVERISDQAADAASLQQLGDSFGILTQAQSGTASVKTYEHITRDGGFRGVHLVAQIQIGKRIVTADQTSLIDQESTKVYSLLISCTSKCFERHRDKIDQIVSSWTVKD